MQPNLLTKKMSKESVKFSPNTMEDRQTRTMMGVPPLSMIGGSLKTQPPTTRTSIKASSKIEPRPSSIRNLAVCHKNTKSNTTGHRSIT